MSRITFLLLFSCSLIALDKPNIIIILTDDLGWGVCVASAGGGGSFQVFAEKDDGTADEIMCLNRNGSIREGQAECG